MCEAFGVEELALRIRATRGRSTERQRDRETERQRDRESRPNPLKDQGDSRKAPRPGDFGRGVGRLHSVAKQASFYIALGVHFQGFWEALGRPTWRGKSIFEGFFRCFFRGRCWHRFLIVFRRLET